MKILVRRSVSLAEVDQRGERRTKYAEAMHDNQCGDGNVPEAGFVHIGLLSGAAAVNYEVSNRGQPTIAERKTWSVRCFVFCYVFCKEVESHWKFTFL